jgi:hypothetical protein
MIRISRFETKSRHYSNMGRLTKTSRTGVSRAKVLTTIGSLPAIAFAEGTDGDWKEEGRDRRLSVLSVGAREDTSIEAAYRVRGYKVLGKVCIVHVAAVTETCKSPYRIWTLPPPVPYREPAVPYWDLPFGHGPMVHWNAQVKLRDGKLLHRADSLGIKPS